MLDNLSLTEQLVASTAIANYRREGTMPRELTVADPARPTTAMTTTTTTSSSHSIAAFMPVMDIDAAVARWESIQTFIGRIMAADEDYGTIAGSKKPSLLKPGAEKLCAFFGLAPEFDVVQRIEQWDAAEPFFHYEIKCRLVRDSGVRGEGLGSCNTRESKYRYRQAERTCPSCGAAAIIRSKFGDCGWLCFHRKGGCGAKFAAGDPAIEGQEVGRVANPDVADSVNTVLKMAKKRALVDAVLNTTGASQFFTQDVEDTVQAPEPAPAPPAPQTAQDARQSAREAQQAVAAQKIAQLRAVEAQAREARKFPPAEQAWATRGEMKAMFARLREIVGEVAFAKEMEYAGVSDPSQFRYLNDARACYARLVELTYGEVA